ncbi:MAG: DUF3307 domain-containing protein [Candidatus Cloacimonas sp.]
MLIWRLLLALFLSDFLLQNYWLIKSKKYFWGLAYHCLIYLFVMLILTANLLTGKIIVVLLILAILHGIVDYAKQLLRPVFANKEWLLFITDQCIHILTIILAVGIISDLDYSYLIAIYNKFPIDAWFKYLALFIVTVFAGIYFTDSILKSVLKIDLANDEQRYNVSCYIGIAERFLITIAVLIGRYELIGFLLLAKSLKKLPEIKDATTEKYNNYVVVGTLLSYSWAIAITLLFKNLF